MINDIPIISPQIWASSNFSILFFEKLTIFYKEKAVFIYLNNMSMHIADYEEKSEKCVFSFKI